MRSSAALALVATALTTANGQVTSNPDGTFTCAKPFAAYCAGDSLETNIIIRCTGDSEGFPGNCNDNLAGVPPVGVKTFAPCYQSSPIAGDAACSYNGIVYGPNGTFPVPGSSTASSAPAADATTYGAPTTSPQGYALPPYPIARDAIPAVGASGTAAPTGTGTGPGTGSGSTNTGAPIVNGAAGFDAMKNKLAGVVLAAIGLFL